MWVYRIDIPIPTSKLCFDLRAGQTSPEPIAAWEQPENKSAAVSKFQLSFRGKFIVTYRLTLFPSLKLAVPRIIYTVIHTPT